MVNGQTLVVNCASSLAERPGAPPSSPESSRAGPSERINMKA
jgi:hypothetical protein